MNEAGSRPGWVVHKFGGTSVADADCIRRVAGLLLARKEPRLAVVVSAMGGMTNDLLALIEGAEKSSGTSEAGLNAIRQRYRATVEDLLADGEARQSTRANAREDARLRSSADRV